MKTVVIGVGNPVLTDDAAGVKAARLLRRRLAGRPGVDVVELYAGGLRLMDALAGYERAVIVDAMLTGEYPPGTVKEFRSPDFASTRNMACAHDADLGVALEAGRMLGVPLPWDIRIWGIEAQDVKTFGEELTGPVGIALPGMVERIIEDLEASGAWPESDHAHGPEGRKK